MFSSSPRRRRLAEDLNYLKTDYRPRFCCGRGNEINVQPGQDVMKFIEDCFKNADSDITIGSPSPNLCLPSVVQDEKTTSTPSTSPSAGLSNSVKRACNSAESLPTVNSRDPEDDQAPVGSPILLEELESSPVHILHLDDQSTAAVKGYSEGESLEDLQTARDKQVDLRQGTKRTSTSSIRKEKSFTLMALAALAPGTLGERCSASISQPSPPPVKDQAIEVESESEFLIVSDDAPFTSSFSIPWKSTKSKKDGSATPVMKSQPSEKKTTQSKNSKSKKVQVEELSKQKMPDLDVRVHDSKGVLQSDPVSSNSEKKVFKSRRQSSAHMGKAKKNSLRQGSPNQKKKTFWEPEAKEMMLSQSGSETEASGSDQCKPRVMPSEDLPMPSAGHQQERTVSLKTYLKSSKCLQLASKASQHLPHKKQNAHQKLSNDKVAERLAESLREKHKKSGKKSSNKKPQLRRGESSDSEAGEEGLEIQPVQLTEVFTSPLPQKLQTSVVQKLVKSGKPKNTWESLGDAGNTIPVKALDIASVQNSEKKRSSAKSGKMPKKIPHRTSKDVCSDPEDVSDTQNTMDSDSSSLRHVARKKQKPSAVKIKSNKRKRNMQHGLQYSFADEKAVGYESGPVLEPGDKFTSRRKSSEQENTFSENSEDWNYQVKNLLSDTIKHKIVMPSNTPNVRRTKRIRMRPLEYWRGERVSYTMRPSGELVISGIVCPETEPPKKIKWRKCGLQQKRDETRSEVPANLDHTLADTSKPTVVLDPVTNKEVLLECVNTENSHSCFFEDESVEIYKNLNTSAFATGTLILKPFKEKGHQYVHMDTIAFHVIHGQIIVTLHKSSYYLTAGDDFYVPAGNEYNIRNLLNEESVLFFTQLKKDRSARFKYCPLEPCQLPDGHTCCLHCLRRSHPAEHLVCTQLNLLSADGLKLTCGECNKPKELFPCFITAEKTKTKQHVDGDLFTITLPAS